MTDSVTEDYIKRCLDPQSELRDVVAKARFPQQYLQCFGDRLMPRPFFVAESEIRRAAADLADFFRILQTLPGRMFGGDLAAYCSQVGFNPREAGLMRRLADQPPELYGRSDLYHDGVGFKLLEFNVGSQLGGIDQAQVMPALMQVEPFRRFAEEHGLGHVHTGEQIARSLRAAAEPVARGAQPVVALLEADGALRPLMPLLLSFQEMLRGCGIDLMLGEVSQVVNNNGKLYLDGTPIDVVLRYFSLNQVMSDPAGEAAVEPIFAAHEAGGTILLTTMESLLYANKGSLALLSDPRWREAFTDDEVELFDRVLPWTRLLVDAETEAGGESVKLLDYCRSERQNLILKPCNDHGGRGITVGWMSTDREWAAALDSAVAGKYIVQERVRQRHEPVVNPQTGELETWVACWSTFLTPMGYSGSHIRALPSDQLGIINRGANAATRLTGVFHTPA
ncbi:MAG TPA: hypothetical protein VGB75_00605 [Jatrophihabitans sp.]|jgi:hypothetical protein|uniref:hypothetical protein n=1 Tax=Jatrophihabitans sp. TaxID=1932789 RepID=UPI002EFC77F3